MSCVVRLTTGASSVTRTCSLDLSDAQTYIDCRILSDRKADARPDSFRKSHFCHPNLVRAYRQRKESIAFRLGRSERHEKFRYQVLDGDGGSGYRRAGLVCNLPGEAGRYLRHRKWHDRRKEKPCQNGQSGKRRPRQSWRTTLCGPTRIVPGLAFVQDDAFFPLPHRTI